MYIFDAECYCDECGEAIKKRILKELNKKPSDFADERNFDSSEFPKGPSDDEAESDCPEHCASQEDCLNPTEIEGELYGHFFENNLTDAGVQYIKEADDGPVVRFWKEYYSQFYDLN